MIILQISLLCLALYLYIYVGYSLFLCLTKWMVKEGDKREESPSTRFVVLIPAHNEELLIGRLLNSLRKQDYPSKLFDMVVVADNCTDATGAVAANYFARVLVRNDAKRRGKGFAIAFAISEIALESYDAVFIIDADSIAGQGALKNLDGEVQRGRKVVQCLNGVENTEASWFTVLMNVSRTLSNKVLEPAADRLGLSSHLVGNGMCFSRDILKKYGWNAFSVGEDWEYHAKLIEAGERVCFAKDAGVYHQESESLRQATPQRLRWSGGRMAIAWRYGFRLMWRGILERDKVKISGAFPLVFPNPSLGVNLTIAGTAISMLVYWLREVPFFALLYGSLLLGQVGMFVVGALYTQQKMISLASIVVAPLFLAWKMTIDGISFFGIGRKTWVRTERKS